MNKDKIGWAVLVVLLALGWMFRHDLQIVGSGDRPGMGYMLNRWTGAVYLVYPSGYRELKVAPAP